MKRIVLLLCVLLVTGCGKKYPETVNIDLQMADQPAAVYASSTASLRGHDAREHPEVVVFRINEEPAVKISNIRSPHIVITERIADGLREQGLLFEKNAPVTILLELNQLLVTITKPKLLYNSEAVSQVTLKVTNRGTTLTRKYNRQASRESASRPKTHHIEDMLNEQLSNIANQILADEELREMIRQ